MPPTVPAEATRNSLQRDRPSPSGSPVAPHKDSPWPHWGPEGGGAAGTTAESGGQGATTSRKGTNFISFSTSQAGHTAPLPDGDRPPQLQLPGAAPTAGRTPGARTAAFHTH